MLVKQSRQAALGDMLFNITNQWRQPLTAVAAIIQNFDDAYEEKILDEKYLEKNIDNAMEIITNLSCTIDDFRNFFQPNKLKNKFNAGHQLQKIFNFTRNAMDEASIDIEVSIEDDLYVFGYENEYSQVIMNILLNAKETFERREIKERKICIQLYEQNSGVVCEISDNAGGIEKQILEKVFDPYFSTKKVSTGAGLGLYMAKMIIEKNMRGSLVAQNWKKGVKFIIKVKSYKEISEHL
ncbi:MAG: HAMP domain-containing sensor histidine kinase [Candidatus Cloacimonadota bacterium]|nr:HAMP domain-containing sensor histidine kinase [Candidatus Cloacimonadota bacterium]